MKPWYTHKCHICNKIQRSSLKLLEGNTKNYSKEKLNAIHRISQASMPRAACTQAHSIFGYTQPGILDNNKSFYSQ